MIEVHPKKYGTTWRTPLRRLFAAMQDKDRTSNRARGLLRIGKTDASSGTLARALSKSLTMQPLCGLTIDGRANGRYIPAITGQEATWTEVFGPARPINKKYKNMGGACALWVAVRGFCYLCVAEEHGSQQKSGESPEMTRWRLLLQDLHTFGPEAVLHVGRTSFNEMLRGCLQPQELVILAKRFLVESGLGMFMSVSFQPYPASVASKTAFIADICEAFLSSSTTASSDTDVELSVPLLRFDLNVATGIAGLKPTRKRENTTSCHEEEAIALSHFESHWAVVVRTERSCPVTSTSSDEGNLIVHLADAECALLPSIWRADSRLLEAAIHREHTETGVDGFVVIRCRPFNNCRASFENNYLF
eukprot:gnl/TRDRNA2_/TRDRNA2_97397_c2_seq1.p1 gnl/TRDRNA2_/TRDRNA2_97397_c2~~gnl/TRDRNA2_/TRDRNA2_97397_c2_seq1.p1  ORF type:complete len:399 (-),score=41.79 gnl/TRDRNA2_/TRDRNA2_97397_c2_seq1:115-1200(-)